MIQEVCHRNFQNDPKYFSMHWSLTNNCNYKCDYCGVWKDEQMYPFEKTIEYINHVNEIKTVDTVLFGGEPLFHPNILQIIGELESKIRVCTNMGKSLNFFRELCKINNDITMVISLHVHKVDLVKFVYKLEYLCEYFDFIKLKVMYDSRHKCESEQIYYHMKTYEKKYDNIKVYLDMVYHEICPLTQFDIRFFDSKQDDDRFYIKTKEGEKYTSYNEIRRMFDGFPNYHGYECDCGKSGLFVDSDGSVSYCQTKKNRGEVIFNVNDSDYKEHDHILEQSIICDVDEPCYEVVVPRRKND